ncbi:MAG: hypothetical protein LBT09_00500, partial [Planctomycetaceae bacterium]|nr:hypothetical protein [Planctomycetaceae bacterium]
LDKNQAVLSLENKRIQFNVLEPDNVSLMRLGKEYSHRNGIIEPLFFEVKGNKAVYSIGRLQ